MTEEAVVPGNAGRDENEGRRTRVQEAFQKASTSEDFLQEESKPEPDLTSRWEIRFGCTLALIAAVLACNDLGAGKYGGDELQLANEKTSAYMWYQSKGIKELLATGQADLIASLLTSGAITESARANLETREKTLRVDTTRYAKEKKEILLGSKTVGQEGWAQDVNGEMGKVIGAEEYATGMEILGKAGDRFDLATLFLQLSLVLGAIGIIIRDPRTKSLFYAVMLTLGVVGAVFSALAYRAAFSFVL